MAACSTKFSRVRSANDPLAQHQLRSGRRDLPLPSRTVLFHRRPIMRLLLVAGVSLLALTNPSLALAYQNDDAASQTDEGSSSDPLADVPTEELPVGGTIDTIVEDPAPAAAAPPPPTGDPILDRLNALEA